VRLSRLASLAVSVSVVLAPAVVLASAPAASASVVEPIYALPGIAATLSGIEAATAAATPYMVGAGTASAAVGTGVVLGGFGVGYGIGWAGQKGLQVAWDKWFTDHPVDNTSGGQACLRNLCANFVSNDAQAHTMNWTYTLSAAQTSGGLPRVEFCLVAGTSLDSYGAETNRTCSAPSGSIGGPYTWSMSYGTPLIYDGWRLRYQPTGSSADWSAKMPFTPPPNTAVAGYRAHNETDCQRADGSIVTLLGDSTAVTSPSVGTQDVPEVTCPPGSHAVGSRVSVQPVNSAGVAVGTVTPLTTWIPAPEFTDPASPLAPCLASAGDAMCALTPYTSNPDGTTSPYDPQPNPSTGTAPNADGCTWGTVTLTATDCGTVAVPPSPTPGTPETQIPTDPNSDAAKEGARCWPSGWALFNPLEWVYQPIRCAFVPSPSTFTDATTKVKDGFDSSPLGQIGNAVTNVGGAFTPGSFTDDCEGFGLSMSTFTDRWPAEPKFAPFYSCDGPGKTVADFLRPFLVGSLWLGAVGSTAYVVGAAFGVKF
jgi:hypothetical protein